MQESDIINIAENVRKVLRTIRSVFVYFADSVLIKDAGISVNIEFTAAVFTFLFNKIEGFECKVYLPELDHLRNKFPNSFLIITYSRKCNGFHSRAIKNLLKRSVNVLEFSEIYPLHKT